IGKLGSGPTLTGGPTGAGHALVQSRVGPRPQVAALLKFVPPAAAQGSFNGSPTFASYCVGGTLPACAGGGRFNIPTGSITGSISSPFSNWQGSGRIDHRFNDKHTLGGRYLYSDTVQAVSGQGTAPR